MHLVKHDRYVFTSEKRKPVGDKHRRLFAVDEGEFQFFVCQICHRRENVVDDILQQLFSVSDLSSMRKCCQ